MMPAFAVGIRWCRRLALGSDVATEPLVPFWATSAAVGVAGNFIGRLHASLRDRWPETHRALIVDSASWPQPIRNRLIGRGAHWKAGSKAEKQRIFREVGYGVPDIGRAILSARNDVTMIAESEIQPFAVGADGRLGVFNEMHFYDLPWPTAALEQLENEIVVMKVTLSYFIEPNLSGRAATRPDTYRSFGLRFAMKKRDRGSIPRPRQRRTGEGWIGNGVRGRLVVAWTEGNPGWIAPLRSLARLCDRSGRT